MQSIINKVKDSVSNATWDAATEHVWYPISDQIDNQLQEEIYELNK